MISKPKSFVASVVFVAITLLLTATGAHAQPVDLRVGADTGNDTLFMGRPGSIIFYVDANGAGVTALLEQLEFTFTNGNFIGPVEHGVQFNFSPEAAAVFEVRSINAAFGAAATDPDTLLWFAVDFDSAGWQRSGEVARITFMPLDTGTAFVDSISSALTTPGIQVFGQDALPIPFVWTPHTITVVPCPVMMGDVNNDGVVTAADVIWYVVWAFRGGPPFAPYPQVGDVNCSGLNTVSDIIYLINHLFKSGPAPCGCFPFQP